MKIGIDLKYLIVILLLPFLFACEGSMFLKSEKKMDKALQGSWEMAVLGPTGEFPAEDWIFESGKVVVIHHRAMDTAYVGSYEIDAKLSRAFLYMKAGKGRATNTLEVKWTVLELKGDLLRVSKRYSAGGQTILDFSKKQ